MALVTTFMTSPVLARIYPVRLLAGDGQRADLEPVAGRDARSPAIQQG